MNHSTAQTLEARHQLLLALYGKIDGLLEQLMDRATRNANAWLERFCGSAAPTHETVQRYEDYCRKEDHEAAVCNKAIIATFERCYSGTVFFLTTYLLEKYGIKAETPDLVFKKCLQQKLISTQEAKKLLKMVEVVDYLCHIYTQEGSHIVSTELVDYYTCIHLIVHRLKIE